MTISGLTKGRVFGESQIAKSRLSRPPAGPSPAPEGGFRVSGLLGLLAESQITATPRHSAPRSAWCQPAGGKRSPGTTTGFEAPWLGSRPEPLALRGNVVARR